MLERWEDMRPTPEDLPGLFPQGENLNIGLSPSAPSMAAWWTLTSIAPRPSAPPPICFRSQA